MTAPAGVPADRNATDGSPAIEIDGLVKRYGGRAVIDGVSFSVGRGELLGLLGPNGAGKTTTVEILEGYRRPDGGVVRVLGLDPVRDGALLRPRLGLMLQGGGIYPQARPGELLRTFARFYRDPLDPDDLLARVGLERAERTKYKVLSGGEKQRLSLALALIGRPEVLILDEPTAGMDPSAKASTRELIAELRTAGATIVLTTHELADVERLADRVVIIDDGRVRAIGTPAELVGGDPRLRFRSARTLEPDERLALGAHLGGYIDGPDPSGWLVLDRPGVTPGLVAGLAAWFSERSVLLVEVRTTPGTLEERFLELVGGEVPR